MKCENCKNEIEPKVNYCPNCGTKNKSKFPKFPIIYETYSHGTKEQGYIFCEENNIDPDSKIGQTILYSNYEINKKIIIYENGISECVEINGIKIKEIKENLREIVNNFRHNNKIDEIEIKNKIQKIMKQL